MRLRNRASQLCCQLPCHICASPAEAHSGLVREACEKAISSLGTEMQKFTIYMRYPCQLNHDLQW
jgi:hypothetical protein